MLIRCVGLANLGWFQRPPKGLRGCPLLLAKKWLKSDYKH